MTEEIASEAAMLRSGNRSRPGQEFLVWLAGEVCLDGLGDEGEDVAILLSAGFYDAEQGLDEAAAGGALGTEG